MQPQEIVARPEQRGAWWRILLLSLLLYIVGLVILALTGNPNLFPTVIILGNFAVPISFVAFLVERRHRSPLPLSAALLTVFYGGVVGTFAAGLLEPIVIGNLTLATFFEVGVIEEFAKILGVLIIARHHRHTSEIDGIILGVAAGMGFAALESTGYAFTAFLASNGSLSATVGVTLLRALLAPLGHGLWTAILAAVLFRESAPFHYRFNWKVVAAFLGASILHGLWDILTAAAANVTGAALAQLVGPAVIGTVGLVVVVGLWRQALRRQRQQEAAGPAIDDGESTDL